MGRNRLKDIFSTNPPLPEIKLLFQNAEAETQFEKAMYLAWDEGHPVNVEGVNGIIAYDLYANCNAGGIIFLKDTSGTRYHVVMCVQNNTVTRLYSAHTQDALKVPYTGKSSFGTSCNSLEYWVFTNSDTN